MTETQFKTNPNRATVAKRGNGDFTLTFPDGRVIGGRSRVALEQYSRKQGFTPDYVDATPKGTKVSHGL